MKFMAKVTVEKMVEKDNWDKGCTGGAITTFREDMQVEFTNKLDFKNKLADIAENFGIDREDFLKYLENSEDNPNRFQYSQNEDSQGDYKQITRDDPDGYLADYYFWVNNVYKEVDFSF